MAPKTFLKKIKKAPKNSIISIYPKRQYKNKYGQLVYEVWMKAMVGTQSEGCKTVFRNSGSIRLVSKYFAWMFVVHKFSNAPNFP